MGVTVKIFMLIRIINAVLENIPLEKNSRMW